MSFFNEEDYRAQVSGEDLDSVLNGDQLTREKAESMAVSQMRGYLSQRFDTNAIFAAAGNGRNAMVVMVGIDLAIYHLYSQLPQRMGLEQRRQRYEDAIKWLEDVAAGKITPELPRPDDSSDPLPGNWGSNKKQTYDW